MHMGLKIPATTCLSLLLSVWTIAPAHAATTVVFALPEPSIKAVPYNAFVIRRGTTKIASTEVIQACDVVEFLPNNTGNVKRVVLATTYSGRNIVLDAWQPNHTVACNSSAPKATLSDAALAVWRNVVSPDREVEARPAATRGCNLNQPMLESDGSYLVSGPRELVVAWTAGCAPFRVRLSRNDSDQTVVEQTDIRAQRIRLVRAELKPGMYTMRTSDTSSGAPFVEDKLTVVDAANLPVAPSAITTSQLSADERALLYVFYLDGLDKGRWRFEAAQRAAELEMRMPAARAWLADFERVRVADR